MRVTVHIPGKFGSSVVNNEGKLIHENLTEDELDKLWQETFVSSVVRSMLDSDDDDANRVGGLVEIRRENLFSQGKASKELVENFIHLFEKFFWLGPKLGAGIEVPQPTLVCNYLVDGFLKCIQLTQSYDLALDVLKRLEKSEPAVASLVVKVLLMKDEEIQAVQLMSLGVEANSRDLEILLVQTEFLINKKRFDLALPLAKQAVKSSPSDFKTWATLVKVYTKLNDFENALLTLNSCPMNSHKDRYSFKRSISLGKGGEELHLPSPVDVTLDEVSNLQSAVIIAEQKSLDPLLANLPAANLKSTFASAYDLLTDIAIKTGWELLLRHRAKVFVMEEEYRKDKATNPGKAPLQVSANAELTDDASTMAVKSPKLQINGISEDLETPELRKKRLCERWLDNLFMLLYEDLRVYTMWQAEFVHFQAQQLDFKKSAAEWEILGQVAFRLKHFKEGSIAFANALVNRFSAKSQREILKYYKMERSRILSKANSSELNPSASHSYARTLNQLHEKILESCIKLLVWNHRWYNEFLSTLINTMSELMASEGLIKMQSLVQAVYSNNISGSDSTASHGITDMMEDMYKFFHEFGLNGADN